MTKRLKNIWNTLRGIWKMLPRAAQVLVILFALAGLAVPILSPDHELWLYLCCIFVVGGLGAGFVIYRLLFRDQK